MCEIKADLACEQRKDGKRFDNNRSGSGILLFRYQIIAQVKIENVSHKEIKSKLTILNLESFFSE